MFVQNLFLSKLNLKKIYTIKNCILFLFITLLLNLLCVGLFLLYSIFNEFVLLITIFGSGLVFSEVYSTKNTTINKNINLTKIKNYNFYLNIFLTMLIFSFSINFLLIT